MVCTQNVCLFLSSADAQRAQRPLIRSSSPSFLKRSLRPALISDNKPRSNLSFVRWRAVCRTCVVWDLNGDSGGAGSKERKYKTLGELGFIQSAGTLFSLCSWVGVPLVCLSSVSQSQLSSRRVITELC